VAGRRRGSVNTKLQGAVGWKAAPILAFQPFIKIWQNPCIMARPLHYSSATSFVRIVKQAQQQGNTLKSCAVGAAFRKARPLSEAGVLSQEMKMKKALAMVITSVFFAGSALAQTPASGTSGGANAATGAAAGGITAGMVAAAVAVVAVAVAASTSNGSSNPAAATTTTTTTTQ
jgi:hypothetical protein